MLKMIAYEFKSFFRDKSFIIWMLIFPLAYFTLIYSFIGSMVSPSTTEVADFSAGLLQTEDSRKNNEKVLLPILDQVDFLQIKEKADSREVLDQALRDGKVDAYIYQDSQGLYDFVMAKNSIQISSALRSILQGANEGILIGRSIDKGFAEGKLKPNPLPPAGNHNGQISFVFEGVDLQNEGKGLSPDYVVLFAALAYLAFYPIQAGLVCAGRVQANQSGVALRKATGPVSKRKLFLACLLPVLIFQILVILLAYAYTQILRVDFGQETGGILLLLIGGTLAAVFTGTMIGALFPKNEGLKGGVAVALPLFFSFMSGMMSHNPSQFFKAHTPWLYQHNPVGLITHGLYVLYDQGWGPSYLTIIRNLLIYILLAAIISVLLIRRENYESL